jgi:hypothetical protein
MMSAEQLASGFDSPREIKPGRWTTRCPVHDGKSRSLYISDGKKGTLVYCQAGCSTAEILAKIGLKFRDLYDKLGAKKLYDPSGDAIAMLIYRAWAGDKKKISPRDAKFIFRTQARLRDHGYFVDSSGNLKTTTEGSTG